MNKVLVAVDSIKDSGAILTTLRDLVSLPENVVLLHVEQLEGNSMMTAMLGEAEMSELRESVKGTAHKEILDRKAEGVLCHYRKECENSGVRNVKTIVREGHPAEEILKVADEEGVDLILMGCSGKSRLQRYVTGCASKDVEKKSKVAVLVAKGSGCGRHRDLWTGKEAYAAR